MSSRSTKKYLTKCLSEKVFRPPNHRRYDVLYKQKWNVGLLRCYLRALRYMHQVDTKKLGTIQFLSYSNSGSHNFFSRIHYLDECFVFTENLRPVEGQHREWGAIKPTQLTALDYMASSVFGVYGLQEKSGMRLKYLVRPFNRLLEYPLDARTEYFSEDKKVMFLVRNFFRVLMSRNGRVTEKGKVEWAVDDNTVYTLIDAHYRNIKNYAKLLESSPDKFHFVPHEIFCARPQQVFSEMMEKLGITGRTWKYPEEFFVRDYDGEICEEETGVILKKMKSHVTMGGFDPMKEPSLNRTLSNDVKSFIRKEWADYAETMFGQRLVELWLTDTPDTYRDMSVSEYVGLLTK